MGPDEKPDRAQHEVTPPNNSEHKDDPLKPAGDLESGGCGSDSEAEAVASIISNIRWY